MSALVPSEADLIRARSLLIDAYRPEDFFTPDTRAMVDYQVRLFVDEALATLSLEVEHFLDTKGLA